MNCRFSMTCKKWKENIWKYQESYVINLFISNSGLILFSISIPLNTMKYSTIKKISCFINLLSQSPLHSLKIGSKKNRCMHNIIQPYFIEVFHPLSYLNHLTYLRIEFCPLDSRAIDIISSLVNLKKLELISPHTLIAEDDFKMLFNLTRLESLSLYKCNQISYDIVALEISKLVHIKSLDLRWTDISSFSLKQVMPYLINLKSLNLSNCKHGVSDGCFIEYLPKDIEALYLRNNCNISTESLYHLKSLTNLKKLDLFGVNNVTNDILKVISSLEHLEVLYMSINGKWNANGLYFLTNLKSLKKLSLLSHMNLPILNDRSLEFIAKIKNLEELTIMSDYITDDGFKLLNNLSNLKKINIRGCKNIKRGLTFIGNKNIVKLNISYSGIVGYNGNIKIYNNRDIHPKEKAFDTLTHFSSLKVLVMKGCENLKKEECECLKKLKSLNILKVDKVIKDVLKNQLKKVNQKLKIIT